MAYVRPRPTLSSIVIKNGADPLLYGGDGVFMHIDIDLIMNDQDVRSNLLDAIVRAFRELGIECLGGSNYEPSLVIEIEDEDVDKVVNLDIEFEAVEILDEADCRMYLTEYWNFVPHRVESSGIVWVDGFEVVEQ